MRDRSLETAALPEGLGHHIEHVDTLPVTSRFSEDFVL